MAGVFFSVILTTGFNSADDVINVHFVTSHSYKQLTNLPFMDDQNAIMFRPGLAVLQKSLQTLSHFYWLPLRLFQVGFSALFFWLFYRVLKPKMSHPLPIFTALFYLLSTPFLFTPYVVYGYVGALVLLPAFCLTLTALIYKKDSVYWSLFGCITCLIAPFIQEFGLLFIPLWIFYFFRQKKRLIPCLLILIAPLYFILRHHVLGSGHPEVPLSHGTGFGTKLRSPEELLLIFSGWKIYFLYLYNLVAQTGNLLFSQPNYGYFSLVPYPFLKLFRLILFSTSTGIIMYYTATTWKKKSPLLALAWSLIFLNLPLTYLYARPRILLVAALGYALLLAYSMDLLWKENSRFSRYLGTIIVIGWILHSVNPISHVLQDKKSYIEWYTTQPQAFRGPLETYKAIQTHYVHDSSN